MRRFAVLAPVLLLVAAARAQTSAGDLTLSIYAKPEGQRLHLLVRTPMTALNGIALPYRGANGELDLARTEAMLPSVARWWIAANLDVYEDDAHGRKTLLPKPEVAAARVSLPSDNAFGSYEQASRQLHGAKLPESSQIFREQAMFDVLLDYPIHSPSSSFAIRPMLARLAPLVTTELHFLSPDGSARNFEYTGSPGIFYIDPTWSQVVQRFSNTGFWHLLNGTDYLLFLFCLSLQFRGAREAASFAAIFVCAYSSTLLLSAYGFVTNTLWFPVGIETLIALSILYLAFEAIAGKPLILRRRALALVFGLIFGYEFSFALKPTSQFAGSHALASVLSFNLGLDMGICLALVLSASILTILFRFTVGWRLALRTEKIVLAVLVADLAWHRLTDRVEHLSQFNFRGTEDAAFDPLSWVVMALIVGGITFIALALRQHSKTRHAGVEK